MKAIEVLFDADLYDGRQQRKTVVRNHPVALVIIIAARSKAALRVIASISLS